MKFNGGETGIRTLGRLAPSTVFENCVSVFNSSHGRQILKEIWHISVMVCHALSALLEKTSSWPRHSLSTWNYSQLVVKLMKTHVPFILNFSSSSKVTKNNETFEVFFWTITSDFCQKFYN